MRKGERLAGEVALVALYLRGAPFGACCARRRWPLVVDVVRRSCADLVSLPDALRAASLWDEAAVLSDTHAVGWALDVCESGRALTFFNESYPRGWVAALGAGAPPCLWMHGTLPTAEAVAVAGSRSLDGASRRVAADAGVFLMSSGWTLVSGGACGTDSIALDAALHSGSLPRCVEVLPYGLDHAPRSHAVCRLSVCEPWATFSTGQAMERNALIYAFGRRAVVVRPRLRKGGTWHGAVDALRRRLASVFVYGDDDAGRALVNLGARAFGRVDELEGLLSDPVVAAQPSLFGALPVREPVSLYCA